MCVSEVCTPYITLSLLRENALACPFPFRLQEVQPAFRSNVASMMAGSSDEEPPALVSSDEPLEFEPPPTLPVSSDEDLGRHFRFHPFAIAMRSYCLRVRRTAQKRVDKLNPGDKDKIETAVQQTLEWLNKHLVHECKVEMGEFEAKQRDFEGVVNPLMTKISEHHPLLKEISKHQPSDGRISEPQSKHQQAEEHQTSSTRSCGGRISELQSTSRPRSASRPSPESTSGVSAAQAEEHQTRSTRRRRPAHAAGGSQSSRAPAGRATPA